MYMHRKADVSMPGVAPPVNTAVMNEVNEKSPLIGSTKMAGRAGRRAVFVGLIGSQFASMLSACIDQRLQFPGVSALPEAGAENEC